MSINPVLESNYKVLISSKNVKINKIGINSASNLILSNLISNPITSSDWSNVPLHPITSLHPPLEILNWIFLVSTLNFSFFSEFSDPDKRFGIRFNSAVDDKPRSNEISMHTGYWSLIVALHKAKLNGINITEPSFYKDCSEDLLKEVFKSDQEEEIPLLEERSRVMREVGTILCEKFKGSYAELISLANQSAVKLVELVVNNFPCYDDKSIYNGEVVFFRKRAQILVAETWAAFEGKGPGCFHDIDQLTMFADYRVPQILHSLSTITYSPHLTSLLLSGTNLLNGSIEEIELRSGSIIAVEEIKLEITRLIKERNLKIKIPLAVELDFLLWDLAKAEEAKGTPLLPHHRTRSCFY